MGGASLTMVPQNIKRKRSTIHSPDPLITILEYDQASKPTPEQKVKPIQSSHVQLIQKSMQSLNPPLRAKSTEKLQIPYNNATMINRYRLATNASNQRSIIVKN